jgi:hypothetical protein
MHFSDNSKHNEFQVLPDFSKCIQSVSSEPEHCDRLLLDCMEKFLTIRQYKPVKAMFGLSNLQLVETWD